MNTIFGAVLAVLAITGCDSTTGPSDRLAEARARARWAERGPASYSITVTRQCECIENGPVVVTVQNGVVESRILLRDGSALPAQYLNFFPSVEGLFERIEIARENRVARLDVRYHPTYGYPTRIAIDESAQGVDDEVTIEASNLVLR